MNSDIIVA